MVSRLRLHARTQCGHASRYRSIDRAESAHASDPGPSNAHQRLVPRYALFCPILVAKKRHAGVTGKSRSCGTSVDHAYGSRRYPSPVLSPTSRFAPARSSLQGSDPFAGTRFARRASSTSRLLRRRHLSVARPSLLGYWRLVVRIQTHVCPCTHGETQAPEGVRDERPDTASGAAAEHTEPKANVRLSGAKREVGLRTGGG
jgi:hypothetical protein